MNERASKYTVYRLSNLAFKLLNKMWSKIIYLSTKCENCNNYNAFLAYIVTPGPGTYISPSDFGYLVAPNRSPRGSTAGSLRGRPRLNFKSQLSTMTG